MSDTDGPVIGDGPARVVGDFPHVAVGVGEGSGHAAPLGACRLPHDLPAGLLSLGKYYSDLFWGSNIVRKLYAGCAVTAKCDPEPQNQAASLEEADFIVRLLCADPAHRLIKGSGTVQIGDAKGYQTDALLHLVRITVQHDIYDLCRQLISPFMGRAFHELTDQWTWRYGKEWVRASPNSVPLDGQVRCNQWHVGSPQSDTTVLVTEMSPARFGPPMLGGAGCSTRKTSCSFSNATGTIRAGTRTSPTRSITTTPCWSFPSPVSGSKASQTFGSGVASTRPTSRSTPAGSPTAMTWRWSKT